MNNNRGNNRRRGRGNNRQQGSGQQLNRIDSRTRGNAPQLLEKYRKLALDAHMNGDRVTEEYNLQFADHYFRVIADTRVRQEEGRQRRDERWQENGDAERDDGDFGSEYSVDADYAAYDQAQRQNQQRSSDQQGGDQRRSDNQRSDNQRSDNQRSDNQRSDNHRSDQQRNDRPRGDHQRPRAEDRGDDDSSGETASDGQSGQNSGQRQQYEPAENPFVRDNRDNRGARPPRPRRDDRRPRPAPLTDNAAADENGQASLDASVLPPAIAPSRDIEDESAAKPAKPPRARKTATAEPAAENDAPTAPVDAATEDSEAKPRKRAVRRPRPAADDTVEVVN